MILSRTSSLKSRLRAIIFVLSSVFFIFSSLLVFIVAFGIEDAVINDQLAQLANSKSEQVNLPDNVRILDNLQTLGVANTKAEKVGEVDYQGRSFHYIQTGEKYLVLELLEASAIQRGLKEILLFLFVALIPCFILTYFISKWIANLALEPYERMNKQLTLDSDSILKLEFVEQFKETDIRNICVTLQNAIQAKYLLLRKQEEFNKSMSHELRTPLQVMTLASESLNQKIEGLGEHESFKRIERSIDRINRTSSALLWLNSTKVCRTKANVKECIEKCHRDLTPLLNNNDLTLNVEFLGDFMPTMPSEVLELVLINLMQNAINHGNYADQRCIGILVRNCSLEIKNPAHLKHYSLQTDGNFGVGLPMIESLLDVFMLTLVKTSIDGTYRVNITSQICDAKK